MPISGPSQGGSKLDERPGAFELGGRIREDLGGCAKALEPPLRLSDQGRRSQRDGERARGPEDRKSTRLNSSHANISYAVFCLKKTTRKHRPLHQHRISGPSRQRPTRPQRTTPRSRGRPSQRLTSYLPPGPPTA